MERRPDGRSGDRVQQLQSSMATAGVDAIVLRLAENVLLATRYWVQIGGLGIAVVPREGRATLIIPEYEAQEASRYWGGDLRIFPAIRLDGPPAAAAIESILSDLCREHGLSGLAIGYEGSFEALAPPSLAGEPNAVAAPTQQLIRSTFGTSRLVDVSETLESLRATKTDYEIERLRTVNEVAMFGCEAFNEASQSGRTEAEIMAEVEAAILCRGHGHRGARVVRGYATVWSGPETAAGWQYFRSRTRKVEKDDVVMLELGTVADGYWADHTRTVIAGRGTEHQREAFAAVLEAGETAFRAARPGASGGDVDAASRAACKARGFEQFPHHTGHGTGFRWHESRPQLVPGSDHRLQAGMVIVTEPGIYLEGLGGFRWEDDAVVTDSGAVRLAGSRFGLD